MKIFIIATASLILIFYGALFNGYFQQDEWFGYSWYILHKDLNFIDSIKFYFSPAIGHYNPFTIAFNHSLFSLWGINYKGFLIISLIIHLANSVAVYFLLKKILKGSRVICYLGGATFALLAAHHQATSWVIANVSTQFAALLGIVSTIFFLNYLDKKKMKHLFISIILLIVSLFFKEITIGLFIIYLGLTFMRKDRGLKKGIAAISFSFLFYLLIRALMLIAPNTTNDQLIIQSQSQLKLIYNFVTVPFKAFSQIIIPVEFLKLVSGWIALVFPESLRGIYPSPAFDSFVLKRVMEILSLSISIGLLGVIYRISRKVKDRFPIILGVAWVLINSLIFSFAPERSGIIFTVDSRNLYFVSIGLIMVFSGLVTHFAKQNVAKYFFVFIPVITFNLVFLHIGIKEVAAAGEVRRSILDEIHLPYPDLPSKVVFYTESDQSYYGLPENEKILPFQSGFGQTLLARYYSIEKYSKEFFMDRFLWEITDQGYMEVDGQGFGYFRDIDLLKRTVKQYNLPEQSIIAFSWRGYRNFLSDISEETRDEVYDTKNP